MDSLIAHPDASVWRTAFGAIRRTDGLIDDFPYARKLASDASAAVRTEAVSAMRYRTFEEAR